MIRAKWKRGREGAANAPGIEARANAIIIAEYPSVHMASAMVSGP